MRKLAVYRNKEYAGTLTEMHRDKYIFRYDDIYFADNNKPPISLTIPKSQQDQILNIVLPMRKLQR